ncbi:protein of unknown function (DUF4124) [Shewanella psychrophila]|uniref:DUF4124 domain-containing protein n=1 Tax=Shewanella psychrophila TaxID=225848 RepID=A0A1S6HWW4_9GAMM|nr:DUF4124 domain-containing protein [Shewanella psychrophila]AQS40067.1 protein of unknown function (DUF4124) [Shewanella psychrophila]
MAREIHTNTARFYTSLVNLGYLLAAYLLSSLLVSPAQANSIYKCVKDNKVVFSQTICPKEFSQHKIEYQLGITTETDSDKHEKKLDPLQALLSKKTISKEKLVHLLNSEIYRLNQELSYFDILKSSELQKIERKRYWEKKAKNNPEYLAEVKDMNSYFDDLIKNNQSTIDLLKAHKIQIEAEPIPEDK